jgi:hypothetical protein
MSGFEIQPLYFSGDSGTGRNLGGTAMAGNIGTATPARATGSFTVASANLTAAAYFEIATYALGVFNLTISGSPALAAPIILAGIATGVDANATATNVKAAIDGNVTLAALLDTTVQVDTPAVGKARVAIVAKRLGAMPNVVNLLTTEPAGATYLILDASLNPGLILTTGNLTGGTNNPASITVGEVTFDALAALTGVAGFPALVDTTANRQAIAAALATAISNIPQFTASAGGGVTVSILGPTVVDGGTYAFKIAQSSTTLFTAITPGTNFFAVGAPEITGPILT